MRLFAGSGTVITRVMLAPMDLAAICSNAILFSAAYVSGFDCKPSRSETRVLYKTKHFQSRACESQYDSQYDSLCATICSLVVTMSAHRRTDILVLLIQCRRTHSLALSR